MTNTPLIRITKTATPLFNTHKIPFYWGENPTGTLMLDEIGLLRCVETILLPNTHVELLEQRGQFIWAVRTEDYPYTGPHFIDVRFCVNRKGAKHKIRSHPSTATMLNIAERLVGTPYVWGGNWPEGIPHMMEWYPPRQELSPHMHALWELKGVDCSGFLYFLSNGYTPRNTSSLIHFGKGIPIEGLSLCEIAQQTQPFDLLVWKGHVVIILDKQSAIESQLPQGVIKTPLNTRLEQLLETKIPIDNPTLCTDSHFVLRRWLKMERLG